jgi:hypothetical protein
MDNRVISIKAEGRVAFDLAVQLMFSDRFRKNKVTHYAESSKGLMFFTGEEVSLNTIKLPIPLDWSGVSDLAWRWLQEQPSDSYADYIDHSGSMGKGFHIYNDAWGHVAGSSKGIMAVKPIWAWYGK